MLHCLLARRAVNGSMRLPQDRLWLLREIAQAALHHCDFAHIVLAFTVGDQPAVDKPPSVDEVRPKVVIRGNDFFVLEHYPKDACGRLEYDKKLIEELDMKTTDVHAARIYCTAEVPPKIDRVSRWFFMQVMQN